MKKNYRMVILSLIALIMVFATLQVFAGSTAKVYMKQGAAEQVVSNGGKITVESGGTLDLQSGATLNNPLATGKIFIGNSAGKAAAQSISGDVSISSGGATSIATGIANLLQSSPTVTGAYDFTGQISIPSNAAPRSNVTPVHAGAIIINTTDWEVCFATTAARIDSWVKVSTPTAACGH